MARPVFGRDQKLVATRNWSMTSSSAWKLVMTSHALVYKNTCTQQLKWRRTGRLQSINNNKITDSNYYADKQS